LRLGESKAANFLAAREWGQKNFLLIIGAKFVDRSAVQRILDGKNHAGGGAGPGNFFDHDGVANVVHSRAAFGFGNGDAGQAEFGGFVEKFAGKFAFLVVLASERLYLRFGEVADAFSQEFLFFGQFEVHADSLYGSLAAYREIVTYTAAPRETATLLGSLRSKTQQINSSQNVPTRDEKERDDRQSQCEERRVIPDNKNNVCASYESLT